MLIFERPRHTSRALFFFLLQRSSLRHFSPVTDPAHLPEWNPPPARSLSRPILQRPSLTLSAIERISPDCNIVRLRGVFEYR